ncbi:MAG TPA: hypothetical protein VM422_15145 [Amaricoccus sp.]|nr:hypothetical protein [Amaricoccus sp.]
MGWPLAVSAGMLGRGRADLLRATLLLALGHVLAMLGILLPFAAIMALVEWQRPIRLTAAGLLVAVGVVSLLSPRHPRALARIPPGRLVLWSFAIALAHGAGLMLLPIYLGICAADELDAAHRASATLIGNDATTAVLVSLVHTLAMAAAGGAMALAVHAWLGLGFIAKSWFNLDRIWALSLILVGGIALLTA